MWCYIVHVYPTPWPAFVIFLKSSLSCYSAVPENIQPQPQKRLEFTGDGRKGL